MLISLDEETKTGFMDSWRGACGFLGRAPFEHGCTSFLGADVSKNVIVNVLAAGMDGWD